MTPKRDRSNATAPSRLDMEVFAEDHVEFATADTPRERLVCYVPEHLLAQARAEVWEAAYDFLNLRWHQGAKFEKVLDEFLKKSGKMEAIKKRSKARQLRKGTTDA